MKPESHAYPRATSSSDRGWFEAIARTVRVRRLRADRMTLLGTVGHRTLIRSATRPRPDAAISPKFYERSWYASGISTIRGERRPSRRMYALAQSAEW